MFAFLLDALFASAALIAIGAIWVSWRQYGEFALAIRARLAECDDLLEARYVVRALPAREPVSGVVIRADFSARRRRPATGRLAA